MADGLAAREHSGAGGNLRVRGIASDTRRKMDELAELMGAGCPSIVEASRRMGLTQSRTDQLWQRIKRDLGPQAV